MCCGRYDFNEKLVRVKQSEEIVRPKRIAVGHCDFIANILSLVNFDIFVEMPARSALVSAQLAEAFAGSIIICRSSRGDFLSMQKSLGDYPHVRVDFTDPATFLSGLQQELPSQASILFYFDACDWSAGRQLLVTELSNVLAAFPNGVVIVNDLGVVLSQELSGQDGLRKIEGGAEYPGPELASLIERAYMFSNGDLQEAFASGDKMCLLTTNADYAGLIKGLPSLRSLEDWNWDDVRQALGHVLENTAAYPADAPEFVGEKSVVSRAIMPVALSEDRAGDWKSFLTTLSKGMTSIYPNKDMDAALSTGDLIIPMGERLEKIFKNAGAFNDDQIQLFEQIFFPLVQRLDQAISVENNLRSQLLQSEYKTIVAQNELRDVQKRYARNEQTHESGDKLMRHIINDLERKLAVLKASKAAVSKHEPQSHPDLAEDLHEARYELARAREEIHQLYNDIAKMRENDLVNVNEAVITESRNEEKIENAKENAMLLEALNIQNEELNSLRESLSVLKRDIKLISASRWVKLGIKLGVSKLQPHLASVQQELN